MMKSNLKLLILLVFAALQGSVSAGAKDVATEQHNVAAASKAVDDAKSDFDAAAERVRQQSQKVVQEENRLKAEKRALAEAKSRYEKAQVELAEQQKKLDQAWDKK
jgi:chromosome segregation ATPase